MNQGNSGRTIYDKCAYQQKLNESITPGEYRLYAGYFENEKACCGLDKRPRWGKIVDVESELKNQTRFVSKCACEKYNPKCEGLDHCISTYDKKAPIVMAPQVCPIVYNNIPKMKTSGFYDFKDK